VVSGSAGGALFKADGESGCAHQKVTRFRAISVSAAPLLLICAACSPASYAVRQRSAERALAAAEVTDGVSDKAPYELWRARLYLTKAREEAGQAHYALARELLATAQQNAVLARRLCFVRSRAEEPPASPLRSRAESPPASTRLAHEQGSPGVREAAR
jgi:hypothetical protein